MSSYYYILIIAVVSVKIQTLLRNFKKTLQLIIFRCRLLFINSSDKHFIGHAYSFAYFDQCHLLELYLIL